MPNQPKPIETCLHLRSKEMFYEVPSRAAEEHRKEVERLFGACDTTAYWCECTQTGRGPDDQPASRDACCRAGRKCFVGIESIV